MFGDNWPVEKQLRYEKKLIRQLLEACGRTSYESGAVLRAAGDAAGFNWFNGEFSACPLALESRRIKDPVTLGTVFRKRVAATEYWRAYDEVRQNWPDRRCGLVFDHHGDDVGDLVLHSSAHLVTETEVVVRLELVGELSHYIQPWKAFLAALSRSVRL